MSAPQPIECVFVEQDASFRPTTPFWARQAKKHYVNGEVYNIADQPERSTNSHRHFFAALHEAWTNLPEAKSEQYPSAEHFRKRGLIECGFYDCASIACASKAEAARVAGFMRPTDEYAVITVSGATVTRYVAKSQSSRAMGKEAFQASKQAVLDWAAVQIGTTRDALQRAGEAA